MRSARRSGSSSSERNTAPWADTGRWSNSSATATSENSSGSTSGAATFPYNVDQYAVKPYGSSTEVPVPADLDFDAWQGPSPMVPYTVDRATAWGGYHCPETSLGFIAGCGIHELGLAQWGNKSDHTSPIRYAGTGSVPKEGIFRTLERWDVTCDYANGVKLRLHGLPHGQGGGRAVPAQLASFRRPDLSRKRGLDQRCGRLLRQQPSRFGSRSSSRAMNRLPVSPEHNRNFIDCVKSRQETICPVEMAIRCDAICQLATIAALTGRAIQWDPEQEKIVNDPEAAKMLVRPYREKWKVWYHEQESTLTAHVFPARSARRWPAPGWRIRSSRGPLPVKTMPARRRRGRCNCPPRPCNSAPCRWKRRVSESPRWGSKRSTSGMRALDVPIWTRSSNAWGPRASRSCSPRTT